MNAPADSGARGGESWSPWRILVVDDEEGQADDTAELLNRAANSGELPHGVEASSEQSFEAALKILSRGGVDMLVLDVLDQTRQEAGTPLADLDPRGRTVFEQVRATRFLPIVFLTALPNKVRDCENAPFVQVVSKSDPYPESLIRGIKACLDSSFPQLNRKLQNHIESVVRDFMVEFVEKNWDELETEKQDVAHLLMRRLGVSFDEGGSAVTRSTASSAASSAEASVGVSPIRYYVVPPPEDYRMGDILRHTVSSVCDRTSSYSADSAGTGSTSADTDETDAENAAADRWCVILTPSCDLVTDRRKADSVVVAECVMLDTFSEYRNWVKNNSKSKRSKLAKLLKSNPAGGQKNRYFYLPKAWKLPDMMVDLQKISHIPYEQLTSYRKEASLDNPYAESLSHQFHCYLGRVGTPDLDMESATSRMRE